jgi:hypothetical protein
MGFLDDDRGAARHPAGDVDADARFKTLAPEQKMGLTLEFMATADVVATKAILLGQTREGFIVSMAYAWDQQIIKYNALRAQFAPPPVDGDETGR